MSNIKKLLETLIVICLTISMLKGIEYLLRPANTDQCVKTIEAFHELPENSLEVIFFGSSHSWRGVKTIEMYEKYGIGAYNYSANWQCISTEALFFYDALRTQKPKVVLFDTYLINSLLQDTELNGEMYYTRAIKGLDHKRIYLKKAFGDRYKNYVSYYLPFSLFHCDWNKISNDNFSEWYAKEEFVDTMGYYCVPWDMTGAAKLNPVSETSQGEIRAGSLEIMDGIVETCKEKNIELIFITIPYEGGNSFHNALEQYAEENNIAYIDMFTKLEEVGIDERADFCDIEHLNDNGAIKVADYVGEYLVSNYDLSDMRKVSHNLWSGKEDARVGKMYITHMD